jgi:hypothetical protein
MAKHKYEKRLFECRTTNMTGNAFNSLITPHIQGESANNYSIVSGYRSILHSRNEPDPSSFINERNTPTQTSAAQQ